MTPAQRNRPAWWQQWVLLGFLLLFWIFLWEAVTPVTVISGVLVALVVTRVFYLPPVLLSGRLNLWHATVFLLWFAWSMALAACQVAWWAVRPSGVREGSVIAVDLDTHSDLLTTLVADVASIIPGSLIVDVDRQAGVLFLHVLNCATDAEVDRAVQKTHDIERLLIRAIGSPRDLATLRERTEGEA